MAYAFEYQAYDRAPEDPKDGYRRKENEVSITVMASDEQDAEKAAKALVIRDVFTLNEVVELSEDLMPIKSSSF